jgi:hypothetical protein
MLPTLKLVDPNGIIATEQTGKAIELIKLDLGANTERQAITADYLLPKIPINDDLK